jgi:hypothetical protein
MQLEYIVLALQLQQRAGISIELPARNIGQRLVPGLRLPAFI